MKRFCTTVAKPCRLALGSMATALVLLGAATAPAWAQELPSPAPPPATPAPEPPAVPDPQPGDEQFEGIAGQVVSIEGRELVVLENNTQRKLRVRVPEGAQVKVNREPASLSNLKVGDHVRVTVAARGSNLAREVLAARVAPNPNPRPAPAPRPRPEQQQEKVDVTVSETRREQEAGLGLVVAAGPNGGVMVVGAQENSPAAAAGIGSGDAIVSLEGEELLTPQEYLTRVREQRPGKKADIIISRGGKPIRGQVELVRRTAAPDVIIRHPAAMGGRFGTAGGPEVEQELEVSTEAPFAGAVPGNQPAAGGDMQRIEQSLQSLLQEIRALRQELAGNRGTPARSPAGPPDRE